MNWDDLRIVATINRTGSFTRAARLLDVDETTIARRLARIEARSASACSWPSRDTASRPKIVAASCAIWLRWRRPQRRSAPY
ncbi:LysR family transcriptional regulator [uncultured Paracoccus sp.]|uniref:helix-turn-helix domain-containing protein n=1 Tax=uncultured Paracoccus sp. TaxID=189685 RepID=UPI003457B845